MPVRNCVIALWTIGPRQIVAWSGPTTKPIDTSLRPYFSMGNWVVFWSIIPRPIMMGTLGP